MKYMYQTLFTVYNFILKYTKSCFKIKLLAFYPLLILKWKKKKKKKKKKMKRNNRFNVNTW